LPGSAPSNVARSFWYSSVASISRGADHDCENASNRTTTSAPAGIDRPVAALQVADVSVHAVGEPLQELHDLAVDQERRRRLHQVERLGRPLRHPVQAHLQIEVDHRRIGRAVQLGERAGAQPAQDVHLRQPVVRRDVALDERGIAERAGHDVRDAVAVAGDVHRRVDPDREVAIERQAVERPARLVLAAARQHGEDEDGGPTHGAGIPRRVGCSRWPILCSCARVAGNPWSARRSG
jgi:hypothetical protein